MDAVALVACEMNDSIIHTFHSCNWGQLFFLEAIKWFNKEKMSPPSAFTELIFGMKIDTSSKKSNSIRKINLTFLYAKYHLYNQKLIHGKLSNWIYS